MFPAKPCPFRSPAAVSWANMYSGWPAYTTCIPFASFSTVSFVMSTPVPAVGGPVAVSDGHNPAHPPVHIDIVAVSASSSYNVRPFAATRILTSFEAATFTVPVVGIAGFVVTGLGGLFDQLTPEAPPPQAAATA